MKSDALLIEVDKYKYTNNKKGQSYSSHYNFVVFVLWRRDVGMSRG